MVFEILVTVISVVIVGLFGYGKYQKKRAEKAEKQVVNAKAYEDMRDVETKVVAIKEKAYGEKVKSVSSDRLERVDLGVYNSTSSSDD